MDTIGTVTVRTPDAVKGFVPALDTAGAYAAGDLLWDSTPITDAMLDDGGVGLLQSIVLRDVNAQGPALTLYITDAPVDFGIVNAAPTISAADAAAIVAIIDVTADRWKSLGGVKVAQAEFTPRLIKAASNTKNFWVAAVVGGAATYTSAAGITGKVGIMPA